MAASCQAVAAGSRKLPPSPATGTGSPGPSPRPSPFCANAPNRWCSPQEQASLLQPSRSRRAGSRPNVLFGCIGSPGEPLARRLPHIVRPLGMDYCPTASSRPNSNFGPGTRSPATLTPQNGGAAAILPPHVRQGGGPAIYFGARRRPVSGALCPASGILCQQWGRSRPPRQGREPVPRSVICCHEALR